MAAEYQPNYYVRILVILLCIFVAWMIIYNFYFTEPQGVINVSLLTLIAILVVIVLSESFDSFSVGKLLAMSRENKKKITEINSLSNENTELRKQIISIASTVNQKQSSTNIFGLTDDIVKQFRVQKASEEEIQEGEIEKASVEEQEIPIRRQINYRKTEELGLDKFLSVSKLDYHSLIKEAKLTNLFHGIDSISHSHPIYDGYINKGHEEVFIEVRPAHYPISIWRFRLYVMLNKIFLYRSIKNINAYLVLVMVVFPEKVLGKRRIFDTSRLESFFEPAIANGLLRIILKELNNEEAESCLKEK